MASSDTPISHSKDKEKGKQGHMQHQLDQINGVEGESVEGGPCWATLPTFPDEPWACGKARSSCSSSRSPLRQGKQGLQCGQLCTQKVKFSVLIACRFSTYRYIYLSASG